MWVLATKRQSWILWEGVEEQRDCEKLWEILIFFLSQSLSHSQEEFLLLCLKTSSICCWIVG